MFNSTQNLIAALGLLAFVATDTSAKPSVDPNLPSITEQLALEPGDWQNGEKLVKVTLEYQQFKGGQPTPWKRHENINMLPGGHNNRTVTSIFFTESSVNNILASYYAQGKHPDNPARVRTDSPLLNRALDGLWSIKSGDAITPQMIIEYYQQSDVDYVLKCADSQPC